MNKADRKRVSGLISTLEQVQSDVQTVADEIQQRLQLDRAQDDDDADALNAAADHASNGRVSDAIDEISTSEQDATKEFAARLQTLLDNTQNVGTELEEMADAEQEKYDNLPESMRDGERGEALQEAESNLREAATACEEGNIQDALDALGNL